MTPHPSDESIVEYLDGTLRPADEPAVRQHLDACTDCRARLATLAGFDEFVQSQRPEDDLTVAAMFEVSERLLTRPRRRPGFSPLLLAATLLVAAGMAFGMLRGGDDGLVVRIVRYAPAEATRAAAPERFHLDLDLAVAAHVLLFARLPGGDVVQLLPDGESLASPRGAVRLPADQLLDWEYPADRLPQELLAVFSPVPPRGEQLAQLRAAFAAAAAGTVPPLATSDGRVARVLAFPTRR